MNEAQLRIAAWILQRCLENGDSVQGVIWLAYQLENINHGLLASATQFNSG